MEALAVIVKGIKLTEFSSFSSTYSVIMPKVKLTPIKQKTKKEEIKEIIQSPDDPLAKYPLRAFGYSNEVGAAVSAMPVWGKAAEVGLWVPALMYLGADIYDKFRRGKEGDYTKASAAAAVEQATFQALASVILPTAAVKMGQGIAGYTAKFDKTGLTATAKEEIFEKLKDDYSKAKFAKGDRYDNGVLKTGKQAVWERVYDHSFLHELDNTNVKLQKEGIFKKIAKIFIHSSDKEALAKTDRTKIENYLKRKVEDIFDLQTLIETKTAEDIEKTGDKKLIKIYKKATEKAAKNYQNLIKERPNYVVEKILSSGEAKHKNLIETISRYYPQINDKKQLVSATDAGKLLSSQLLENLMQTEENKKLIAELAKKAEASGEIISKMLQNKVLKLGLLKTTGGFIALGCLAVPIDHFVHKYIIKKFVEPGIENVVTIKEKLSFKQSPKNNAPKT